MTELITSHEPKLPNLEETLVTVSNLHIDIGALQDNPDVDTNILLDSFYYPLIAVCYIVTKKTLNAINKFPDEEEAKELLSAYFFCLLRLIGNLLEQVVSILAETNPVADQMYVAHLDRYNTESFQWNRITTVYVAQWLMLVLNTENHLGSPPFFIFIDQNKDFPPLVPKIFEGNDWVTGFHNRFLVPNTALKLGRKQSSYLWSYLLSERSIYDNESIDHTVRDIIFSAIADEIPETATSHLDLCGGRGDFIEWLQKQKPDLKSQLIDIADKAVEEAKSKGIRATVASAEDPLPVGEHVDAITVIFAIQWISGAAISNAFNALKPGGTFITNAYPPTEDFALMYCKVIDTKGFVDVAYKEINLDNGKKQFILVGKKPEV